MILVAGGDSFVWGIDLKDARHDKYSKFTYSAILAENNNIDYVCAARPGNSNDAIARMTMLACESICDKKLAVIVSWTFMTRYEFLFNYSINSPISPWCSINPHNNNKVEVSNFSDYFFKHVGSNDIYQQYNTLQSIVLLQTYLNQKNIPYMFTLSDNYFCKPLQDITDPNLIILRNLIDWNKWFFFPSATEPWLTTTPRGFYQWAVENKYSIGPDGHPLEQAHRDAAILIKEKFDELVKKHH